MLRQSDGFESERLVSLDEKAIYALSMFQDIAWC